VRLRRQKKWAPQPGAERALDTIGGLLLAEDFTEGEKLASIYLIVQGYFTITDPATVPPYK
jgi:hypothetical protein